MRRSLCLLLLLTACREDAIRGEHPFPETIIDPPRQFLDFGPEVANDPPPLPISGGTLLISRDLRTAIVGDPDQNRILVVDLVERTTRATVELEDGDEPGRSAEDSSGRAHAVLRSG